MHGNTQSLSDGRKTRDFSVILDELQQTIHVHRHVDSLLGGVHFELTADDVTECVGGPQAVTRDDLHRRYESPCDPRLNLRQSLEMAHLLTDLLRVTG